MENQKSQKTEPNTFLTEEDKMIAALCYPFWFVMSAWILLTDKKREVYLHFHALQSLYFGAITSSAIFLFTLFVYIVFFHADMKKLTETGPGFGQSIGCGLISILGFTVLTLIVPLLLGISLWLAWRASRGVIFRLPLIGPKAYSNVCIKHTDDEREYLEYLTNPPQENPSGVYPVLPYYYDISQRYEDRLGPVNYEIPGIDKTWHPNYGTPKRTVPPIPYIPEKNDQEMMAKLNPAIEHMKTLFTPPEEDMEEISELPEEEPSLPEVPDAPDFANLDTDDITASSPFMSHDNPPDVSAFTPPPHITMHQTAKHTVHSETTHQLHAQFEDHSPTPLEILHRKQQAEHSQTGEKPKEVEVVAPPPDEYSQKMAAWRRKDVGKKAKLLTDEKQLKIHEQLEDLYAPAKAPNKPPDVSSSGSPGKQGGGKTPDTQSPFRKNPTAEKSIGSAPGEKQAISEDRIAMLQKRFQRQMENRDAENRMEVPPESAHEKKTTEPEAPPNLSPEEQLNQLRKKFEVRQQMLQKQATTITPEGTDTKEEIPEPPPTIVLSPDRNLEHMKNRLEESQSGNKTGRQKEPTGEKSDFRLSSTFQGNLQRDTHRKGSGSTEPAARVPLKRIPPGSIKKMEIPGEKTSDTPDTAKSTTFFNPEEQLKDLQERYAKKSPPPARDNTRSQETPRSQDKVSPVSPLQILSEMQKHRKSQEIRMTDEEKQVRGRSILDKMEANLESMGPKKQHDLNRPPLRKILPDNRGRGTSFLPPIDEDDDF